MTRDLIQVFINTQSKYLGKYIKQTEELINNGTYVYTEPIGDMQIMPHPNMPRDMRVKVVIGGTVEVGREFTEGKTAILNFADALVPGGLLLSGATTQEENICRCSNLYASLTSKTAERYYKDNYATLDHIYTDDVIYSKDVLFYKDDNDYSDVKPYKMDVITCPAPSIKQSNVEKAKRIINQRVEQIIKVAVMNKVDNLVLGAWGCGAFGQDPEIVSKAFMSAIKKYPAFKTVVFALRGNDGMEMDMGEKSNYTVFLKNCEEV